jgi:hypothetical protein
LQQEHDEALESKETLDDEEMPLRKKTKLREEIEALLEKKGLVLEEKISVMNLEIQETYYFNDYHEAMDFLKGKKGRWYITTPGIKKSAVRTPP